MTVFAIFWTLIIGDYAMVRIYIILTFLLFVGCGPHYGDFYPCHDDGTVKPRIVMLPIVETNKHIDHEKILMQNIKYKLMDRGECLHLLRRSGQWSNRKNRDFRLL